MKSRTLKKIFIMTCMAILITAVWGADSRTVRWEKRTDRLTDIRKGIDPGEYLPSVIKILDEGIESSINVSGILKRYEVKDGSLRADTRKYSVSDIESRTMAISRPVISYYYLLYTTRRLNDSKTADTVAGWIASYADSKDIPEVKPGSREYAGMVKGFIMEMCMGEYSQFEESCYKKILGKTEYELSRTDYNSNDINLEKYILDTAITEAKSMSGEQQAVLNEKYLTSTAEWKIAETRSGRSIERDRAAEGFAIKNNLPESEIKGRGLQDIEKALFLKERAPIISMIENSTSSVSSGSTNPEYEIPDFGILSNAIDDIDSYRASLIKKIDGTEKKDFAGKVRENNSGIAKKYITRFEAIYKKEEARIENLKKNKSGIIIYNEELFFVSKKHFGELKTKILSYAGLSSDFIEAVTGTGKSTVTAYLAQVRYMSARRIEYLSFIDKLAKNPEITSVAGSEKIFGVYRQAVKKSQEYIRDTIKPLTVPAEIRKNMSGDDLKELASINESLRGGGLGIASSVRNSYELTGTMYKQAKEDSRAASTESESKIAQKETDTLFGFARSCAEGITQMKKTDSFLKEYASLYSEISDNIKRNVNAEKAYTDAINSGSILGLVKSCTAGELDREQRSRELLAKEGADSLSGAISLCEYYKRSGIKVELVPTDSEINEIKKIFSAVPETKAGSWKMNGINYREVDAKCTETLKQMLKKNAWTPMGGQYEKDAAVTRLSFRECEVSFKAPDGWSRSSIECDPGSAVRFVSPDNNGLIELYAVPSDTKILQNFTTDWLKGRGLELVEKSWGKIKGEDYFRTICRDRSKKFCETRMFIKNGCVVIISGVSDRDRARFMAGIVDRLFRGLDF